MRAKYGRRRGKRRFRFQNLFSNWNWGKIVFFGITGGFLLSLFLFYYFTRDLPDPSRVRRKSGFSTEIYDRTGENVLFDLYVDENRKFTSIDQMPEYLKQATVAIEDKDFYLHNGFDFRGILRGFSRLFTRGRAQGGSTLTQQMVKNVLLSNERSVSRKLKELVLAIRIEKRFTKDEILQMYLNEAPYGGSAWGVAAASELYFGKTPKDLNLTESVILAGMPQAPSRYSPYGSDPLAYVARAKAVARRMREDGYIDDKQEGDIVSSLTKVKFRKPGMSIKAPHFVMYVRSLLEDMFGSGLLEKGGLKVVTSLDWKLQEEAEKIVAEEIDKVSNLRVGNGASVIIKADTGEILSMVGSKGFFDDDIDGQVNVVTRLRQPGSSIKPVVYATALSKGYTPASVLMDVVTEFPGKDEDTPYIPKNYDGKEHGLLHLRDALASSINVPAVKLLARVGVGNVLELGYKMGLSSLKPTAQNRARLGLSMALGGGEVRLLDLATAYSAFANGGLKIKPVSILKVEDRNGKVLYEYKKVQRERVLSAEVAFLIDSILSDNNARLLTFGPNSYLNLGDRAVAVKTGTTNDLRDNWTIGWSSDVLVGVWVGNNDNTPMKNVASGVTGASPIWRREILSVLAEYPDKPFVVPDNVSQVELDKISGYPAHNGFKSYKEWIVAGSLPLGDDPVHKYIKTCPGQPDKLASKVHIAQGNFDKKEVVIIKEDDPLTGKNLWQMAIDGWLFNQTDDIYKVPSEVCDAPGSGINIDIVSPSDKSRVNGSDVEIVFDVVSDKDIEWADLYLDGVKERRFETKPYKKSVYLSDGNHKIKIMVRNSDGMESDKVREFSVNIDWVEASPTPSFTPIPSPSPSVMITITPSPSLTVSP